MNAGVKVVGLDELLAKMRRLAGSDVADKTLIAYAEEVKERGTVYPPETEANQPPPPYYIRGQGTNTGSSIRKTSDDMKHKWELKKSSSIVLSNAAKYSEYVQGRYQPTYHKQRGWINIYQFAHDNLSRLKEIFHMQFKRAWK
jgi:hypothetical protein